MKIEIRSEGSPGLDAFLEDRLYEYNSGTTGVFDGELFSGEVRDPSGNIIAAVSGHTWGGCCEVLRLWVHESKRNHGLGSALMRAAEAEALRRGCTQVLLSTYSFQAPVFYERLGYRRFAAVADYPKGHVKHFYLKQLTRECAT